MYSSFHDHVQHHTGNTPSRMARVVSNGFSENDGTPVASSVIRSLPNGAPLGCGRTGSYKSYQQRPEFQKEWTWVPFRIHTTKIILWLASVLRTVKMSSRPYNQALKQPPLHPKMHQPEKKQTNSSAYILKHTTWESRQILFSKLGCTNKLYTGTN